ncbi:MAG: molecular chaperone TorD family protein [Bacillota bacterium]
MPAIHSAWKTQILAYGSRAFSELDHYQGFRSLYGRVRQLGDLPGELAEALDRVAGCCPDYPESRAGRELEQEFLRLFLTPGGLRPYESAYRPESGDAYDGVRRFYRDHGLSRPARRLCPEDHVAVELQVLAEQWGAGRQVTYYRFLKTHLSSWLPRFFADVKQHTESPYFHALADLLLTVVELDMRHVASASHRPVHGKAAGES